MITKIQLKNFQAHEDTSLDLVPGINAITGKSDSGKSAILRGLYWLNNNRPGGNSMVSFWNRNKAGEAKDETSVLITQNGSDIKRMKSKDLNAYQVGEEKPLEALRSDVPQQVQDILNLGEVNIQKQMDAPFLLSETSGEVARFFNRIIKLDSIDTILAKIESDKRSSRDKMGVQEDLAAKALKSLEGFAFLDEANSLLNKAGRVADRIKETQARLGILKTKKALMVQLTAILNKISKTLLALANPLKEALQIQGGINSTKTSLTRLKGFQIEYKKAAKILVTAEIVPEAKKLLEEISKTKTQLLSRGEKLRQLNSSIFEWNDLVEPLATISQSLEKIKSEKPSDPICPTCGQPIQENK